MKNLFLFSLVLGVGLACDPNILCNECTQTFLQQGKCTCNPDGTCQKVISGNYVMYPFSDDRTNTTEYGYSDHDSAGVWYYGAIRNFMTARFTQWIPSTSPIITNKCAPESVTDLLKYIVLNGGGAAFLSQEDKYLSARNGATVKMAADATWKSATERFTKIDDTCTYSGKSYSCNYLQASNGKYISVDNNGYWYPDKTNAADASRFYFVVSAELPIKKYQTLDRYFRIKQDWDGEVVYQAVNLMTYNYMFRVAPYSFDYFDIMSKFNWKHVEHNGPTRGIQANSNYKDQWKIEYPTAAHDYYTLFNQEAQLYLSLSANFPTTVGENEKLTAFPVQSVPGCGNGIIGNNECPNDSSGNTQCCSSTGYCSVSNCAVPCGGGYIGNGQCVQNQPGVTLCCSQYGWCGSTSAYCG